MLNRLLTLFRREHAIVIDGTRTTGHSSPHTVSDLLATYDGPIVIGTNNVEAAVADGLLPSTLGALAPEHKAALDGQRQSNAPTE